VCLERIEPVANSVANCKAEFTPPPNFDHDIVLEAVSNKKISPRPKLLAETTMKIDFITKTDVGGIRIL